MHLLRAGHEQRRIMQIRLQRAFSPEYMVEEECGICGVPFRVESVMVEAVTDSRHPVEVRLACPECIAYLAERNPSAFPSIEEYRAAVERYPAPMFPSGDEVLGLEEDAFAEAFASSWIR
jgi:hypothetical protein